MYKVSFSDYLRDVCATMLLADDASLERNFKNTWKRSKGDIKTFINNASQVIERMQKVYHSGPNKRSLHDIVQTSTDGNVAIEPQSGKLIPAKSPSAPSPKEVEKQLKEQRPGDLPYQKIKKTLPKGQSRMVTPEIREQRNKSKERPSDRKPSERPWRGFKY